MNPRHSTKSEEERVLRENLSVHALSPEALQRIRRATEAEWRASVEPARRRWVPYAAAASVVLVALAGTWSFLGRGPAAVAGASIARLERADSPGVVEELRLWRDTRLNVGQEIRGGHEFASRGATLFALNGGGNLRFAPGAEFQVIAGNTVRLERGEMYVDIPPGSRGTGFVAITAAGEFRHLGTQFALAVIDGETRLRVREGSVQWQAADNQSTVEAGTEVLIGQDQRVTRRVIESTGEYWAWTESMAPAVDIEGRPLSEFLDWVSRETGRKLIIADDDTRRQLAAIRMHGDIHGLQPLQALKAVVASTSLQLDLPPGAIRVSFAGASPASTR